MPKAIATTKQPASPLVQPVDPDAYLTDQQRAFVRAYVTNQTTAGDHIRAAISAGYAEDSARGAAYHLLGLPHVLDAIARAVDRELKGPVAVEALTTARKLVKEGTKADNVRLRAALGLLDRGGYIAPRERRDTGATAKPLESMSQDELRAMLDDVDSRLAQLATDVTPPHDQRDQHQEQPATD